MLYQISFELNSTTSDYKAFFDKLKSLGAARSIMNSTWLVSTELNAEKLTDLLHPLVMKGDRYFISEICQDKFNGWQKTSTWDWIDAQLGINKRKEFVGDMAHT